MQTYTYFPSAYMHVHKTHCSHADTPVHIHATHTKPQMCMYITHTDSHLWVHTHKNTSVHVHNTRTLPLLETCIQICTLPHHRHSYMYGTHVCPPRHMCAYTQYADSHTHTPPSLVLRAPHASYVLASQVNNKLVTYKSTCPGTS